MTDETEHNNGKPEWSDVSRKDRCAALAFMMMGSPGEDQPTQTQLAEHFKVSQPQISIDLQSDYYAQAALGFVRQAIKGILFPAAMKNIAARMFMADIYDQDGKLEINNESKRYAAAIEFMKTFRQLIVDAPEDPTASDEQASRIRRLLMGDEYTRQLETELKELRELVRSNGHANN